MGRFTILAMIEMTRHVDHTFWCNFSWIEELNDFRVFTHVYLQIVEYNIKSKYLKEYLTVKAFETICCNFAATNKKGP